MELNIGDPAPDFTANTNGEGELTLNDLKSKWVVLYFYPKDNTSGCTKEACAFRDNMDAIAGRGAEVVGVSPDSVKSHDNFIKKHELNFRLVSDPEKEICQKYGCWVEKKMYGRTYMGVQRSTFIIDPEGIIRKIYPKVKVAGHVEKVIEDLEELKKES